MKRTRKPRTSTSSSGSRQSPVRQVSDRTLTFLLVVALILSLTWFVVVVTVANSMTIMAAGTVNLKVINCGDSSCDYPYETNTNCPADCHCGDGYCYGGYEDQASCPSDCGAPPVAVPVDEGRKEPVLPAPLPTSINETLDLEGVDFIHIYADFIKPTEGASAEVSYIDCDVLEKMLYSNEVPFKCFFTKTINLVDANLENAQIITKVREDWVEAYNIDLSTIKVIRFYTNQRTDLPTEMISPDDERFWISEYDPRNIYFLSSTDGFTGFFLIVGEQLITIPPLVERPQPYCGDNICDATIGEGCGTCAIDCCCVPGYDCVDNMCVTECLLFGITFGRFLGLCWYWWIIIAVLLLAIIYLLWKKRKRKMPLYLMLMVLLLILIPIAFFAGKFRKKKSTWERLLDTVSGILKSLE